jgi:hypothetical protein
VSGTEGAERARAYLAGQLEALGIRVEENLPEPAREPAASDSPAAEAGVPASSAAEAEAEAEGGGGSGAEPPAPEPRNLVGVVPGASEDLILLVAPYDSPPHQSPGFVGANDGGSGAAVLLALAPALASAPLPYTTWLLFLDGEASGSDGSPGLRGSAAAADRLARAGLAPRVRLLLAMNRVCDPELRVARDLLSHRPYREEVWKSASRLGYRQLFEQERFEQPRGSHWAFQRVGVRSVALMDSTREQEEAPDLAAGSEDDDLAHCSARSLDAVASVSLDALQAISRRLAKVDRFSAAPDLALTRPAPDQAPAVEAPPAEAPEAPPAEAVETASPPAVEP